MRTKPIAWYSNLRLTAACLAAVMLVALQAAAFPILTNVVETGGDNEATDTITAKWTGVIWNTTVANEPILATPAGTPFTVPVFGEDIPAYVDRAHQWNGATTARPIPSYLLGGEYIMLGNDNRDNNPFQLDLYLRERAVVFMLIDCRNGDTSNSDPPFSGLPLDQWTAMLWMNTLGFQPLLTGWNRAGDPLRPDEVGFDEGADGVGPGVGMNQYASIYYKIVDPGSAGQPAISLLEPYATGQSMYGVVVTPVAPTVPTGLSAASMDARVALSWNLSPGAREYVVKRSGTSGGPYTPITTNSTLGYVDTAVVNFQTYYYVVSAVGLFGESANSAQVIGTPKLAPASLVAVGGTNQVALSWTALASAASYTVKRADVSGGPFVDIVTGLTGTSYIDSGLANGRRYYYTVSAALSGGGESANADETVAFTAPNAPASFAVERFAATVIRLSWTTADQVPATSTTLVEKSSDGITFVQAATVTGGMFRYLDAGLAANLTNYYRVRATNSGGFSTYSAVMSATTPASGVNVNFADSAITGVSDYPIPGYLDDFGLMFADQGNGYSYGWSEDNTANDRLRNAANSPDRRYDTLNHLQKTTPGPFWEIAMPSGLYLVHIVSGDATATDSVFQFDVEGYVSPTQTPAANSWWREFNMTVKVQDGRLTVNNGPSASNNKICFIDVYPALPMTNTITVQPISQTVTQNQSVTFSVAVSGGPEPYGFQWYKGATPIVGENGASYTIPFVSLSDQGPYSVAVTNAGASVNSQVANLTVIPDTFPPVAVSAGSVDGRAIGIGFNEPLDSAIAGDLTRYLVNGSSANLSYVSVAPDQRTVYAYLVTPITANFTVTVNGVKDLAGNTMGSTTVNGVFMGLTGMDLGNPLSLGSSTTSDGIAVEIVAGGTDIWNTADEGYYVYKAYSGDFDAKARVVSLTQANVWSKAGIMLRETLAVDSRNVFLCTTPLPLNNVYQMQWRDTMGGASASANTVGPVTYPDAWIRLIRSGSVFTSMIQTNGADWVTFNTYTAPAAYPVDVYLGLAVTAHDGAGLMTTGRISSFAISAPAGDVGLTMLAASGVAEQGGAITYTITARNQGTAPANSVVVTDTLPQGVTYVSSVASAGTATHDAGTVTWTVGDMSGGQSATLTLTATATTLGPKVNTATATAAAGEQNPANNVASTTVVVASKPTIGSSAVRGGKFTFTVSTEAGVNYVVEYTANLTTPTWTTLSTIIGTGSTVSVEDPAMPAGDRFYRTRLVAP